MGFISDIFDSKRGTGWNAGTAPLQEPINADQVEVQRQRSLDALAQQQQFVDALNGQNGIQNQQNVFNQLQGVANGTGPNPAQAMLAQSTGANVANQAALAASQRGAGANVGLIGRQAAQQGVGIQQQAAGQGATLQANQSLNALNQLGGIAGQQVGQQGQGLQAYSTGQQNLYGSGINALGQRNATQAAQQASMNSAQGALANTMAQGQQAITGGLIKSASSLPQLMASGGVVPQNMAIGGIADTMSVGDAGGAPEAAVGYSPVFNYLSGAPNAAADSTAQVQQAPVQATPVSANPGAQALYDAFDFSNRSKGVGKIAAMALAKGGNVGSKLQSGGKVPGTPKVSGAKNDYANDIVDAKLSPGEIVLPRSVTQSKDPVGNAAKFVQAVMAKQSMKKAK